MSKQFVRKHFHTNKTLGVSADEKCALDALMRLSCPVIFHKNNQEEDDASMSLLHRAGRSLEGSTPVLNAEVLQQKDIGRLKRAHKDLKSVVVPLPPHLKRTRSKAIIANKIVDIEKAPRSPRSKDYFVKTRSKAIIANKIVDIEKAPRSPRSKDYCGKWSRDTRHKREGEDLSTTFSKKRKLGSTSNSSYDENKTESGVLHRTRCKRKKYGPPSDSSQFKEVTFQGRSGRWEAHIWEESKQLYLGSSVSWDMAARAYDRAALRLKGTGAVLNYDLKDYEPELPQLFKVSKDQTILLLRRQSSGLGNRYPKAITRGEENSAFSCPASHKGNTEDSKKGFPEELLHQEIHDSSKMINLWNLNTWERGSAFTEFSNAKRTETSERIVTASLNVLSNPDLYVHLTYLDWICCRFSLAHKANEYSHHRDYGSPIKLYAVPLRFAKTQEAHRYDLIVKELLENTVKL